MSNTPNVNDMIPSGMPSKTTTTSRVAWESSPTAMPRLSHGGPRAHLPRIDRAAAVDGNSVWIASEYVAHTCDYTNWGGPFFAGGTGDNLLGTCAGASHGPGARTALANWSTRISKLTP